MHYREGCYELVDARGENFHQYILDIKDHSDAPCNHVVTYTATAFRKSARTHCI